MRRRVAIGVALAFLPVLAGAQQVEYYHLDVLGSVRAVTDANGEILTRHDYEPYGEEWEGEESKDTRRFTGKERDDESGLDYFGARYYSAPVARFTSVDPVYTWSENLTDPERWNRYAYARNNPLRYVDPDGRAIETPWDAINVGIGVASFTANVAAGNVGSAAFDALGIVYDVVATATPVLPGGAGTLIKGIRGVDRAADVLKAADQGKDALVTLNRAAGKIAEEKVAQELVSEGYEIIGSQVCCRTPQGRRFIDHLTKDATGNITAVEVKSGRATRSVTQRAKDTEIASGRGTFAGKNAPFDLKGTQRAVATVERRPQS